MPPFTNEPEHISDAAPRQTAPKRLHKKKKAAPKAAAPPPAVADRLAALDARDPATRRVDQRKAAAARSPQRERLRKGLEKYPAIDILERRLLNPHGTPSEPIQLKDQPEPMELHWFNGEIPGRTHEARHYLGYLPVHVNELVSRDEVSDLQESPDGCVTRGERGREWLGKIPKRWYDAIQRKKADVEARRLRSSSTVKKDLLEAAASTSHRFIDSEGQAVTVSGDEAASMMLGNQEGGFFGEVKSYRETIQFTDEADA
jgi:hypothetical protein